MTGVIMRQVCTQDHREVFQLVSAAFGTQDEAELVNNLRAKGEIRYDWLAEEKGKIIGHLALSEMLAPVKTLALAPVSVLPMRQGQGVGSALITKALMRAKADGWICAVVLGDPNYYGRFGFDVVTAQKFKTPYPPEYTGIAIFDAPAFAKLDQNLIYPPTFEGE